MTRRKKLSEIQSVFEQVQPEPQQFQPTEPADVEDTSGSLTASLKQPKKKLSKIRFTLDLEKPLDDRLNRAANKLNRSKAELTRFALERLLDELEEEWQDKFT